MQRPSLAALLALVALFSLSGCSSVPTAPLSRPSEASRGEILVYRESAFSAGGVSVAVGSGATAYAALANSEAARAFFPAGATEIYVQARSAEPTKLSVNVEAGKLLCLRTSASASTYAKAAVPVALMLTGYHFYLDEVPCPSAEELAKYKMIAVAYQ